MRSQSIIPRLVPVPGRTLAGSIMVSETSDKGHIAVSSRVNLIWTSRGLSEMCLSAPVCAINVSHSLCRTVRKRLTGRFATVVHFFLGIFRVDENHHITVLETRTQPLIHYRGFIS